MDELVERLRDGEGLTGLDGDIGPLQHADDLECVEGIAAGRLVHLGEQRPRQRRPEVLLDHPPERLDVERSNGDPREPIASRRAEQLGEQRALEPCPPGEEDADGLRLEPPDPVREGCGGGVVEPLGIVDRDEHVPLLGHEPQCVHDRDAERPRLERRAGIVPEREGTRERGALRGGQRREHDVEYGVEEVADPRERQRGLALHRLRLQHEDPERFSPLDGGPPERRLAHPGVAFEHEPHRTVRHLVEEGVDRLQLGFPTDERGHDSTILRLRDTDFVGSRPGVSTSSATSSGCRR